MDRRTKQWRALASGASGSGFEPPQEPTRETIDGILFDYRREPRCRVCSAGDPEKAPPRGEEVHRVVHQMLVQGRTYRDILTAASPLMEGWPEQRKLTYHSIRRHQLRHLPVDELAVRQIVERRAAERGLQIALGTGPLVTTAGVLELVRQRGFEALAGREVVPTVRETVEAARLLDELEKEAGSRIGLAELTRQVEVFLDVVRQRLTPDQWATVVAEVEARLTAPALEAATDSPTKEEEEEEEEEEDDG